MCGICRCVKRISRERERGREGEEVLLEEEEESWREEASPLCVLSLCALSLSLSVCV
jgi:hypothetical protein